MKVIAGLDIQPVDGKVVIAFLYNEGSRSKCGCLINHESFTLHAGVARQIMQKLQEVLLGLEQSDAAPLEGTQDGLWMGDQVNVRLHGPRDEGVGL
jgi:hypothetical protein